MKRLFILIIFIFGSYFSNCQITVCSWNLENFGKSKSDIEIKFIANTVKDVDVLVVIEVVSGGGGAQAVARLSDALNRTGEKWDYTISAPTVSNNYETERYAFIWKTNKLTKQGDAWLDKKHQVEIEREPFIITLKSKGKLFSLVAFHAIPKSKQPETEIKYLKYFPAEYPDKNLIICGDFNCPQSHSVFFPLKAMGYKPILTGRKTTLRQECINADCLASEFDNIFYNATKVTFIKAEVIAFYLKFTSLKEARAISDHLPILFQFTIN